MELPVFITSNPAKAAQLGRHLGIALAHQPLELPEIQSLDLAEVVEHKAKAAYALTGRSALVEDTSLVFPVMGRLPGPFIKWFLSDLGLNGLCGLVDGSRERAAIAQVMFGLYDGDELHLFDGEVRGHVAGVPRGNGGFGGWDPIFIPEGYSKTWAEMTDAEQAQTSMRRLALRKLEGHLRAA